MSKNTFILGVGNIGSLIATALKPKNPNITLLFKKKSQIKNFAQRNNSIITLKYLHKDNNIVENKFENVNTGLELLWEWTPSNYIDKSTTDHQLLYNYLYRNMKDDKNKQQDVKEKKKEIKEDTKVEIKEDINEEAKEGSIVKEELKEEIKQENTNNEKSQNPKVLTPINYIDNLIITTKASDTFDALIPLLPLINKDTNLIFIQNGGGVIEELFKKYYKNEKNFDLIPQNIYLGIINHGVYKIDTKSHEYVLTSANTGTLTIGKYSIKNEVKEEKEETLPEIVENLLETDLNVKYCYNSLELKLHFVEKLLINSVINPLTTILECKNGELMNLPKTTKLMDLILKENIKILQNHYFKEFKDKHIIRDFLNFARIKRNLTQVILSTSNNYSSMLQDYKFNKNCSEIYNINGFFIHLNNGYSPINKILINLIENKISFKNLNNEI